MRRFGRWDGFMAICLDTTNCGFHNRDKARFCARCGLPMRGALLQGRYEIHDLMSKDRVTATLGALDRHEGTSVTVRALLPNLTGPEDREIFLQDAELAVSFSSHMHDPDSIRVTDYGQDGPVAFLVKSKNDMLAADVRLQKPRMTVRVAGDVYQASPSSRVDNDMLGDPPLTLPQGSAAANRQYEQSNGLTEGDRAYELGRYEEALAAYNKILDRNAALVEAWSGKGATLLHLGH